MFGLFKRKTLTKAENHERPRPPAYQGSLAPRQPISRQSSRKDDDECFSTSMIVGMATGSPLIGMAMGGSIIGGMIGAEIVESERSTPTPSPDTSASDSSSSYGGGGDSGSSSSCGGDSSGSF